MKEWPQGIRHCRKSEWSVVPARTKDTEIIKERSQHEDSDEFRQRKISASDEDLGSRAILENENDLIWYPAEVNTSIRPGWFYHEYEDDKVRSLEELTNIYFNSVGGNATFLLNIPPTREGLFHKNDVARLQELGDFLRNEFANPIKELDEKEIKVNTTSQADNFSIRIDLPLSKIKYIIIQEDIEKSQRVESFEVLAKNSSSKYETLFSGTTIGYKKIIRFEKPLTTDSFIIKITSCRCELELKKIVIY